MTSPGSRERRLGTAGPGAARLALGLIESIAVECYGRTRLPRLLTSYRKVEEPYWRKDAGQGWVQTDPETALETQGSESFYSLGLFVVVPSGS